MNADSYAMNIAGLGSNAYVKAECRLKDAIQCQSVHLKSMLHFTHACTHTHIYILSHLSKEQIKCVYVCELKQSFPNWILLM